jgi:uncharacterized small protein (DUF1192 family)
MDLDELFPAKPLDPLSQVVKQDLDPLSVEELHERIQTLEGEIARVRARSTRRSPICPPPKRCSRNEKGRGT